MKNKCGLDHYQVCRYDAWCQHITLSMAALAALTAIRDRYEALLNDQGREVNRSDGVSRQRRGG